MFYTPSKKKKRGTKYKQLWTEHCYPTAGITCVPIGYYKLSDFSRVFPNLHKICIQENLNHLGHQIVFNSSLFQLFQINHN